MNLPESLHYEPSARAWLHTVAELQRKVKPLYEFVPAPSFADMPKLNGAFKKALWEILQASEKPLDVLQLRMFLPSQQRDGHRIKRMVSYWVVKGWIARYGVDRHYRYGPRKDTER